MTTNRMPENRVSSSVEDMANLALDMIPVLQELVADVRIAALSREWPDLCITYRKAQALLASVERAK